MLLLLVPLLVLLVLVLVAIVAVGMVLKSTVTVWSHLARKTNDDSLVVVVGVVVIGNGSIVLVGGVHVDSL